MTEIGLIAIGAGLAIGLAALATGLAQAKIGAAAIAAILEKPETFGTMRTAVLSRARLSARHVLLQAKREILEAVWHHVSQKAMSLTGHARRPVLNALLDEILSATASESPRVIIDSRERPYLEDILKERSIPFEEQQQDGLRLGIRLEADGEVLTNCFAARLAKAKPELTIELNRLLFTEETVGVQRSARISERER